MRVLVASWLGSTNLGDELIFAALHRKLTARGARVVGVSLDPPQTRAVHGVNALAHSDVSGIWNALQTCDALLFGGGGLLQDETSPLNVPYHLSRVFAAGWRATPAAAVGIGAGPLDTALARGLVRAALRRVVGVSVRDAASADVLESLGVAPPHIAADLALSLPAPAAAPADRIVVSLRPWAQGGATPVMFRWQAGLHHDWFVDGMAAALDATARATGLPCHFVAFQRDRDHLLHEMVASRMDSPATLSRPGVHDVVEEVAASRVVVGMRYHAGIAAALAGRPMVLIGYSSKVPSLAHDIRDGVVSLGWRPDDIGRIPAAVDEVLGRDASVAAARDVLRLRERGNDAVIDRLLDAVAEPTGR